ncbi:MAG: hypothetical protein CVV44_12900 [Spirochaetae bacterium HGW-Spirochaetae-1]|jgi:small subunit ribosomal protein S1|nr:MAG: hypothetical protein CVV44_12900 [Spirochaetae bacterium HGW-Spirochaetae-1]
MDHLQAEEFNESIDMEQIADSALDEIKPGQIIHGEIVTIDNDYAYVNVGTKSDGRISLEEFDVPPSVGTMVDVMLQNRRIVDGVYQFSKKAAEEELVWNEFTRKLGDGVETISGRVIAATSKGKLVSCDGVRAFLPFSLSGDLKGESSTDGECQFKIKSIDRKKKSIVVSRKEFLDEENVRKWESFAANYSAGDKVEGEVIKFVEFGAFVRVEGIDALLHRNDMSWKNVFKQRKILKQHEKREFIILNINREEGKISLGLKQMAEDPWINLDAQFRQGEILKGTVVTIVNMGAFVDVGNDVEGFLSNSELSWTKNNASAKDILEKGQEIDVVILDINKDERKLLLGYRQTQPNPWMTIHERFPVGSVHRKKIKKIVKFGLFVELEDDIDGLIHISDISWDDHNSNLPEQFRVGDEVDLKVLEIKKEEMKIACGMKQLLKSPWEAISEKYQPRMQVRGTISGITQFGIFLKLEENVEGLVHISEVSKSRIEDLDAEFSVGDVVNAVVLGVDVKRKRLSLSIKQFDVISEKEELDKILKETSPSTMTLGNMVNIKLN